MRALCSTPASNMCKTVLSILLIFAVSVVFLDVVTAMTYKTCGENAVAELNSVSNTMCPLAEPCHFQKGKYSEFTANFTANRNITRVRSSVSAWVLGIKLPFGEQPREACGLYMTCPVIEGTPAIFIVGVEVADYYPAIRLHVEVEIQDMADDQPIFCVVYPAVIIE